MPGHDPERLGSGCSAALLADPSRRATLSLGAVAHAADFGWDATADGMRQVYAEALATHQRAARSRASS